MNNDLERLSREIGKEISLLIEPSGILFRIFQRAKSTESIVRKVKAKNYEASGNKMQDVIGVRITLYFNDDIEILYKILRNNPKFLDETKDINDDTSFKPQRLNLIFKLNDSQSEEIFTKMNHISNNIDGTFEIQIRTVLSEGWHEVEHDLRYKNKEDWNGNEDISRVMNGIYATLETQDWSILSIFEKLAYRHYKIKNWDAMLRSKIRIRFIDQSISSELINVLNTNDSLGKAIYKVNRLEFLENLINDKLKIPLTMDNVLYILNIYILKNKKILEHTPQSILTNDELIKHIDF